MLLGKMLLHKDGLKMESTISLKNYLPDDAAKELSIPGWWKSDNPYMIGDSVDLIRGIPDGVFDLIVTDPPFTFGLGSSIDTGKLDNWNDLLNGSYFFKEIFKECYRVLKPNGAMWISNSWRSLPCLMKALADIGCSIESLLVWHKDWIGPGGSKGLRPSYEVVALVCKGAFAIPDRGIPDVKTVKWCSIKPNHPAEKPLDLIKWLISISGDSDYILDPFAGSGTTLKAAKELGKIGLGFEINPAYESTIRKRLAIDIQKLDAFERQR